MKQLKLLIITEMGLFDNFTKSKTTEMEPVKAVAIAMMFVIAADGEMKPEEAGQFLSMLGGKEVNGVIVIGGQYPGLLSDCKAYVKSNKVEDFIKVSDKILTDSMKMYVIMNQLDSSLSDGVPDATEQEIIGKFMAGWNISQERVKPIYDVILFKNDRSVFLDLSSAKNKDGYAFKVAL